MNQEAGLLAKLKKWVRGQQIKKARRVNGRYFTRDGEELNYEVGKLLKSRGQQIILMSAR